MSERENKGLANAKAAKNDEFYTQYEDIQKELNAYVEYDPDVFRDKTILLPCDDPAWSNFTLFFAQNFSRYGIKKLISTSYALERKKYVYRPPMADLFASEAPVDDPAFNARGKIFTLDRDQDRRVDIDNLQWDYLEGDGDFRSTEVKRLRDQADFIITNPPFSLFREFLAWIVGADKKFLIIGNINCITYKEVFPLIMNDKIWLGPSISSGDRMFNVPDDYPLEAAGCGVDERGNKFIRVKGVRWLTNIEHKRRHQNITYMSMADYIRYSKHKEIRGAGYRRYDNYDAIDVPYSDSIPIDYDGVMGVPITFLDKYNPDQFEILGSSSQLAGSIIGGDGQIKENPGRFYVNGKRLYDRIAIRRRR